MGAESLELYVDEATQALVRDAWRAFADNGLPSSWRGDDSPWPHITVQAHIASQGAVVDVSDPGLLAACEAALDTPFALTAFGLFAHKKTAVLYLAPAPSHELLEAYRRIMSALPPLTAPIREHWTPHCTLSQRLPYDQLPTALDLVKHMSLPIVGSIERVVYKPAGAGGRAVLAARA